MYIYYPNMSYSVNTLSTNLSLQMRLTDTSPSYRRSLYAGPRLRPVWTRHLHLVSHQEAAADHAPV